MVHWKIIRRENPPVQYLTKRQKKNAQWIRNQSYHQNDHKTLVRLLKPNLEIKAMGSHTITPKSQVYQSVAQGIHQNNDTQHIKDDSTHQVL